MDQSLEQFLLEVPSVIWELELSGTDWIFTRRYGEWLPHQRRDLVGMRLSELFPKGHPVQKAIQDCVGSKQPVICIDATQPGHFYQTRCKPICDGTGKVVRLVGVSIDVTDMIASHLAVISTSSKVSRMLKTQIYEILQTSALQPNFDQYFYMVYQPIVDLNQSPDSPAFISGVEALIRMRVGNRTIPPSQFLPSIESSGQTAQMTQWMIQQVCRDTQELLKQSDLFISINIGVDELLHPETLEHLRSVLTHCPTFAQSLHLEILETVHRGLDPTDVTQICYDLRDLGVKLAIDDFGIQGSNIDRLGLLATDDFMKIDKSFIPQQVFGTEASIYLSIVWVGKAFQLNLIAEGVETLEQANFIKNIGCDYAQGYYFYQPLSTEELSTTLETWSTPAWAAEATDSSTQQSALSNFACRLDSRYCPSEEEGSG